MQLKINSFHELPLCVPIVKKYCILCYYFILLNLYYTKKQFTSSEQNISCMLHEIVECYERPNSDCIIYIHMLSLHRFKSVHLIIHTVIIRTVIIRTVITVTILQSLTHAVEHHLSSWEVRHGTNKIILYSHHWLIAMAILSSIKTRSKPEIVNQCCTVKHISDIPTTNRTIVHNQRVST